jgi:hypothetical protein
VTLLCTECKGQFPVISTESLVVVTQLSRVAIFLGTSAVEFVRPDLRTQSQVGCTDEFHPNCQKERKRVQVCPL